MPRHRYRITVTPVRSDGLPCSGRCSIEFERASTRDWMRQLEADHRLRGMAGDEGVALTIGLLLLDSLDASRLPPPLAALAACLDAPAPADGHRQDTASA